MEQIIDDIEKVSFGIVIKLNNDSYCRMMQIRTKKENIVITLFSNRPYKLSPRRAIKKYL